MPSTAAPILTCGEEVAGCLNTYDSDYAYLIRTSLGYDLLAYDYPCSRAFLTGILSRDGLKPDKVGKLNRRRCLHGNPAAWFLIQQHK